MTERLEDFHWLLTADAGKLLDLAFGWREAGKDVLSVNKKLREHVEPERAAKLIELVQNRLRGQRKFKNAHRMFFTRRTLEMATDSRIAGYKAKRFQNFNSIGDICCSIGGDLISLAKVAIPKTVTGYDLDPLAIEYAKANLKAHGIAEPVVRELPFEDVPIEKHDALHIDPERRKHGRATQGHLLSPTLESIFDRTKDCEGVGIKVAPATKTGPYFPAGIEREWIGHSRECKQQMIWCQRLAAKPAHRLATRLGKSGSITQFSFEDAKIAGHRPAIASQIESYIYEPHSVLLASSLSDAMATELNLEKLAADICYYTSDSCISNKLLARFRVAQILRANLKNVARAVQQQGYGELEIKKRGVPEHMVENYRRIKLKGAGRGTLILTQFKRDRVAIIATREKAK